MTRLSLWMALVGFLSCASCKNNPSPPPPAAPSGQETNTKSSEPDPNDLLQTLQGRWQSEQDPSYTLEIADTQMRHYNQGKLSHESMIEVDGGCESAVCKPDGVDTSDGWCFTEMSIEEGKYAAQCNFVTRCDTALLQYRSLSGNGKDLVFKKSR